VTNDTFLLEVLIWYRIIGAAKSLLALLLLAWNPQLGTVVVKHLVNLSYVLLTRISRPLFSGVFKHLASKDINDDSAKDVTVQSIW